MSLYEFGNVFTNQPRGVDTLSGVHKPGASNGGEPIIDARPVAATQTSDVQSGRTSVFGKPFGADPTYVEEFLIPGFRSLDEAMKMYWSGMRVPTKDSYRFMRVKVAGGDKSLLVWNDELRDGRVRLPVASLDRTKSEFNVDKYSPPYLAMNNRYVSRRGDLVAKVFRPVPWLVDYSLTVWAEHKRDAEYISYQVLTRFNPLAEFTMYDTQLTGNIQLRFSGHTDASDKESGSDQHANTRYEYNMTAEAWLPLPEQLVPTILGRVKFTMEDLRDEVRFSTGLFQTANGVQQVVGGI